MPNNARRVAWMDAISDAPPAKTVASASGASFRWATAQRPEVHAWADLKTSYAHGTKYIALW